MQSEIEFSGHLFFLVGNSGSGKDSLLREAMEQWPENYCPVRIPQRYITRPPHETEPFISVTSKEFKTMKQEGKFCLSWHIYDLDYGVPLEVLDWLKNGDLVVVNVSRSIIPEARKQYPELKVIFVQVPFEITLGRIKSRGRESEDDPVFKARVERARSHQSMPDADFIVGNIGALEIGGKKLKDYLIRFAKSK